MLMICEFAYLPRMFAYENTKNDKVKSSLVMQSGVELEGVYSFRFLGISSVMRVVLGL